MKKLFLLFSLIIVFCCKQLKQRYESQSDKYFIENFKQVYFSLCLRYSFNNSDEINKILKEDMSSSSDFLLGIENYKFIDSLSKITAKQIKKDSIESIIKRAEGSRGKRVFKRCLDDYTSKWLDSLAKARLKMNNK